MKFKHGDHVMCEIEGEKIDDARISINEDGTPFICQNYISGLNAKDKLGYKHSWMLNRNFNGDFVTNLNLAEPQTSTMSYRLATDLEIAIKTCEDAGYVVEKWKPQEGRGFWYFNSKGDVVEQPWYGVAKQLKRLELGNCFPTRGLCEAALLEVKSVLRK